MENNIFWKPAMTHEKICTKKKIRTGAEEREMHFPSSPARTKKLRASELEAQKGRGVLYRNAV